MSCQVLNMSFSRQKMSCLKPQTFEPPFFWLMSLWSHCWDKKWKSHQWQADWLQEDQE
jgi:hypothetical protein